MKILLTGRNGQVGFELNKKLKVFGDIFATDYEELDLSNIGDIRKFVSQIKPDIIINPAAYTAVDKAESEFEIAYRINTIAPKILAEIAGELNIPLIHFSTDYVFDGLKKEPYLETDKTNPQSSYGITKDKGEEEVRKYSKHIILRTSWVFGSHGNNFLKTILKLIQEKDELSIVNDQWGSPTSASMLADVTYIIVKKMIESKNFSDYGTYHVTSEGEINWYQYAVFIANEAMRFGLKLKLDPEQIKPLSTSEFPTPAKRPSNSRLNTDKIKKTFMIELPHWKKDVSEVMRKLFN
jgi:dTDP-4-dehydrorhamnose reductase